MKKALHLIFCLITALTAFGQGEHYVQPYTRSNGTYVEGHYRTNPNATKNDNYSTFPNINPHTGKMGTKPGDSYTPNTYTFPDPFRSSNMPIPTLETPTFDMKSATERFFEQNRARQEFELESKLAQEKVTEELRRQETAGCLSSAKRYHEQSKLNGTGNFYPNGPYQVIAVINNTTCQSSLVSIKNNRVVMKSDQQCQFQSFPIKDGRGVVSATCMGVKGKMSFYFMQ